MNIKKLEIWDARFKVQELAGGII